MAASRLRAKAQFGADGLPRGTFEVWRRGSREMPMGGRTTVNHPDSGRVLGYNGLLSGRDQDLAVMPSRGLTLFDCLRGLPGMADVLHDSSIALRLVRGACTWAQLGVPGAIGTVNILVHPASQEIIEGFSNQVRMLASAHPLVTIQDFPSGFNLSILMQHKELELHMPSSIAVNTGINYFVCDDETLNEFGLMYVALHICGNFARYYPDLWLAHIEKSSPLALAINEFLSVVRDRMPLNTLSELSRVCFVQEVQNY